MAQTTYNRGFEQTIKIKKSAIVISQDDDSFMIFKFKKLKVKFLWVFYTASTIWNVENFK